MWMSPLLVLLNGVPVYVAYRLSQRLHPEADRPTRTIETTLGYLAICQTILFIIGTLGVMNIYTASALLLGLFVAFCFSEQATQPQPATATKATGQFSRYQQIVLSLLLATCMLSLVYWPKFWCLRATHLNGDDYWYRYSIPIYWLANRSIETDALFGMTGAYPKGMELFSLWFMLPFQTTSQTDCLAWVNLTSLPMMVLVLAGYFKLIAPTTPQGYLATALAATLVITSAMMENLFAEFGTIDAAGPCLIIAAMAIIRDIPAKEHLSSRVWYRDVGYITTALGLAIGIKMLALPISAVLFLYLYYRAYQFGRVRVFISSITLTIAGCLLLAGYWYLRNWNLYGNPFYPAKFLGLPAIESIYVKTTLKEYFTIFGFKKGLSDTLAVYLNWPLLHGILALLGMTVALLVLSLRRSEANPLRTVSVLALLSVGVCLVLLPGQPWSAGHSRTFELEEIHFSSMRYVTILPLIGWIWFAMLLFQWKRLERASLAIIALIAVYIIAEKMSYQFRNMPKSRRIIDYLAIAGVIYCWFYRDRLRWKLPNPLPWLQKVPVAVYLLLLVPVVMVEHRLKAASAKRNNYQHVMAFEWGDVLNEFNKTDGLRVVGHYRGYSFLLGERFQHIPLTLDRYNRPVAMQPQHRDIAPVQTDKPTSPPDWSQVDVIIAYHMEGHGLPIPSPYYDLTINNPNFEIWLQTKGITIFKRTTIKE